jgi:hypothetical protein
VLSEEEAKARLKELELASKTLQPIGYKAPEPSFGKRTKKLPTLDELDGNWER